MTKIITKEIFIEKAKIIHGDKYDYSLVVYVNAKEKLIIKCKKHGIFLQSSNKHLSGHGCHKCNIESKRYSINTFIEKATKIHNNKYNYSKAKYSHSQEKILITCNIHGDFLQQPSIHLLGVGCPKCKSEQTKKLLSFTTEIFIQKAKLVHGDRFDYSLTSYINNYTKVKIKCRLHGEFEQTPHGHLKGQGCPICKSSKGEFIISNILDNNNINYIREYRIPNQIYRFEYDFYLPDRNILIEFHGIQHYKFVSYFHKEEDAFLAQKERDIFKRQLAKELKYKLIEINYNQLKYMTENQFKELILNKISKI